MRIWLLVASLLLVASCDGEPADPAASRRAETREPSPSPAPVLEQATALIATDDEPVLLRVELAATPEERERGLMHRDSLPEDAGMVFLFFEEHRGGFWMKNTKIPLSIAFFDEDGEILSIMDMDPCERGPCPTYDPGVPYYGALEVNQSAFQRWGVEEGDTVSVSN